MSDAQIDITVRPREPNDDAAIASVVAAAFRGNNEVTLIDALRLDGTMICELVAVDPQKNCIGHIAFSRLTAEAGAQSLRAAALAPLAVSPHAQRKGVGDTLTRQGLAHLREAGEQLAVVLGHPAYYARFGFSSLLAKALDAPYAGESFMAMELAPGALRALRWRVAYPRAFAR